ncbi:MAG TPA: magnesium transporter CorA family protein [Acidobacteriota bacterium]|nr:magnesium transporter CorA family protein [Acidobacteriota bacterium]
MSKIVEFDLQKQQSRELSLEEFLRDGPRGSLAYWADLNGSTVEELSAIAEPFKIPDRVLRRWQTADSARQITEDASSIALMLDYWSPGRTIQGSESDAPLEGSIRTTPSGDEVSASGSTIKVSLFLSERFFVSYSPEQAACLTKVDRTYERNVRFAQSIGFLLFLVLDQVVQDYVGMLPPLEIESESIDDRIFDESTEAINEDILRLKRRTLRYKRVASAVRDLLMHVSGRKIPVITEAGRGSLAQVYHHAQVLVTSIEGLREMINSSLDSYRSLQGQKLNETMKVLTLFASIMMPMTLIAGIYGMNFQNMPELAWPLGYFMALGVMGLTGIGLLLLFRVKGWF